MTHPPGETYLPNWALVVLTEATVADGTAELRWELHDLLLSGVRNIVVDVSRIDELSSTILATLLSTHRACRARGGGVTIRQPNSRTLDLLHHTGLHRVFQLDASGSDKGKHSRSAHSTADSSEAGPTGGRGPEL